MALVPLSWWESRNYPSLPGLTAADFYCALNVAGFISGDFYQDSELLHIARRTWAKVRMWFASLTDKIVSRIATYRSLLPNDSFFSDLQTEWRSLS